MTIPTAPSRFTLILTTRCNMNCSYCYQRAREQLSMDLPTALAAADLALAAPGRGTDLTFYGGEPLLELELMRRVVEHVESVRPRDERVKYWVVTNGALITHDVTEFFSTHNFKVLMSFDGVAAAQDMRSRGSFETLDRVLDAFREAHPDYFRRAVEISVTVPPVAVPHLADSVDYLLTKGASEIDLTPVMTPGPGWNEDCHRELVKQFERIRESSLVHLEATGKVPLMLYSGKGLAPDESLRSRAMCEIVDANSWAVDVDGTLSGCTLFAPSIQDYGSELLRECRATLTLGSVTDPGILEMCADFADEVRVLPIFSEKEKKYSSYRRCADCRFFAVCVTCPTSIGFAEGNTDPHRVPDYYCAFNYTSLASRDGFPVQPTDREAIRGDRFSELRLRWEASGEKAENEVVGEARSEPPEQSGTERPPE